MVDTGPAIAHLVAVRIRGHGDELNGPESLGDRPHKRFNVNCGPLGSWNDIKGNVGKGRGHGKILFEEEIVGILLS